MVKYLICTAMLLGATACIDFEQDKQKFYNLEEIKNTEWYNEDIIGKTYYSINYTDVESKEKAEWYNGQMKGYSDPERTNEIDNLTRTFIYNFTPATTEQRAVVKTKFEDGVHLDGYVIPKGNLQVGSKDVYIIQLFEVNEDGEILMDNGTYKSTLMMWKE